MPLVLTKENGTGLANANAYASVADADAYHEGHLYATAWTGATADRKAAALVFATRLIDTQYQFSGCRTNGTQALQWPRANCPDPDAGSVVALLAWWRDRVLPSDAVPAVLVQATCELARELLVADRTAAPAGEGILTERTSQYNRDSVGTSSSTSASKMYSKSDTRPMIPRVVQGMLGKYGTLIQAQRGSVRLERV
jgi:hypothetical protein